MSVPPPTLSGRDVMEARELRRRRAVRALMWGTGDGPEEGGQLGRGIWFGVALTVAIAIAAGVVGVVQIGAH